MNPRINLFDRGLPPSQFAGITTLYTDLDGSLFAPGGTVMTKHDGTVSAAAPLCLQALREAGVEVVIVTGRSRAQTAEIARVLNIGIYIGEIGGFVSYTAGEARGHNADDASGLIFHKGDWSDLPAGKTPLQVMEDEGVIDALCAAYPGLCERVPMGITNAREVSVLVFGNFDTEEASLAISTPTRPVHIIDNGEVSPTHHGLSIDEHIHIYHVLPAGISKGAAVALDIEKRHLDRAHTLAIGDSCGDVSMACSAGSFVLVGNGLDVPEVSDELDESDLHVLGVRGYTIDGWVECARAILASKGFPDPLKQH